MVPETHLITLPCNIRCHCKLCTILPRDFFLIFCIWNTIVAITIVITVITVIVVIIVTVVIIAATIITIPMIHQQQQLDLVLVPILGKGSGHLLSLGDFKNIVYSSFI